MKICQLCAIDFTLKKFLLPLVDGQRTNGDEVIAVCSDGDYVTGMRKDGYHIDTIPVTRSMHPVKHLYSIWKLYWYFRRESFDVVHVHTPVAALLGRIAAFLARVPTIVYTAHGFYFHEDMPTMKRGIHIGLERFAGLMTDLLFTQSAEDAQMAVDTGIMSTDRVFAIGNGVDISLFAPGKNARYLELRKELDIPEDAFVIGMIGRQVEEKGIVEFLQAARILAGKHSRVYFLLIGDRLPSDHAKAVDQVIKDSRNSIGKRLVLTGMRNDIPDLLGVMNAFTLPSWREGMPRTIIEAMMMALPVVATDIRGSREEIVPGETGLLVPVRNHRQLAKALQELIENPDRAQELGKAGRKRALSLYDESKVVALQIRLTERFASKKHKRNWSKRIFDLVTGSALLVVLAVPMAGIALWIRLTSKGPVLYWSDRVGQNNIIFKMPKFRSMQTDTPAMATHLMTDPDAFLTPIGGFLRKYSLDEFPQLFSILRGDMSLVGPRPALYNQDDLIALRSEKEVDQLLPGLTGWAQVNGRDELPIPGKVAFDVEYMKKQSFWFDLQILWKTFTRVIRRDGVAH